MLVNLNQSNRGGEVWPVWPSICKDWPFYFWNSIRVSRLPTLVLLKLALILFFVVSNAAQLAFVPTYLPTYNLSFYKKAKGGTAVSVRYDLL